MAVLKNTVNIGDALVTGNLTANSIIKRGGTSSLFLKADGSVDSNSYSLQNVGTITINYSTLSSSDLSAINNIKTQGIYSINIIIVDGSNSVPTAGTLIVETISGYCVQIINVALVILGLNKYSYYRTYDSSWSALTKIINGIINDGNNTANYTWSGKYIEEHYAPLTHSHGNITSTGSISSSVSIAANDRLVIRDSDNGKIETTNIVFDGATTNSFLSKKGTWETAITSHQTVTNSAPTLAWNTTSTVGTIGGTALTVKMPSNPNTDTKVTVSTTNSKVYLSGALTTSTTSLQYVNSNVYMNNSNLYCSGIDCGSGIAKAYEVWVLGDGENESGGIINFGDKEDDSKAYCYIEEDYDDHLYIKASLGVLFSTKACAIDGFFQTSDKRQKNIISEISLEKAYDLIDKCQTILYTLKDDKSNKELIGMIAQEIQEFFPEIISEDKDGNLSLDYSRLTVIIFKVLKDLIKRLNNIETKIKES